jgi:hypothetical protein
MHLPPPAQWRLGRSKAHAAILALLALLQGFSLFLLWNSAEPAAWWGLLALALALSLHAGWRWWNSPAGTLRWTGSEWHVMQAQTMQVCSLRWVFDGQAAVLVHSDCAVTLGSKRWFWLERGAQSGPGWTALRRAIFADAAQTGQETPYAQTAAPGGATMPVADRPTWLQAPQAKALSATAAMSAGNNGSLNSKLR